MGSNPTPSGEQFSFFAVPWKVRTVERSVLVEPSREVALAESAIGNEADSEFHERRQHLRFRVSPPQPSIRSGVGVSMWSYPF